MKKSIAVGALVSCSMAGDFSYQRSYGDTPLVDIQSREYPKAGLGYTSYRIGGTVPSDSSRQSANRAIFDAINGARSNIGTIDRSIDSLFLRLPSIQ